MGFGPEVSPVQKVSFNPEAGLRFREQYEKKYGARGQLLIERFGQGLAMQGPSVVDVDQLLDVVRPFSESDFEYIRTPLNENWSTGIARLNRDRNVLTDPDPFYLFYNFILY